MSDVPVRFQNVTIKCRRCSAVIGQQVADGQILLVGDVAVMNWIRGVCLNGDCQKPFEWASPNLIDDLLPDSLQDLPGVGEVLNEFRQARIGTKDF
jgi:hypothetical protein